VPDDDLVEADNYSGPDNGDLRLGGDQLEWLALEVCSTLKLNAMRGDTNYNVFDRWRSAFQGMHIICSFTTGSLDLSTPGQYFASLLDGRWPTVIYGFPEWFMPRWPLKVIDAWFEMTTLTQADDCESAVVYENSPGTDTHNDYIHGHGHVSADPVHGAIGTYRVWVPHVC
jgi:hypothetical protein